MDCVSRRIICIENRRVRDIDTHVYGESHATPHHHRASRRSYPVVNIIVQVGLVWWGKLQEELPYVIY